MPPISVTNNFNQVYSLGVFSNLMYSQTLVNDHLSTTTTCLQQPLFRVPKGGYWTQVWLFFKVKPQKYVRNIFFLQNNPYVG